MLWRRLSFGSHGVQPPNLLLIWAFAYETCYLESMHPSGQVITTSADVTLNGGLIRELPQNPLNSGLGIILICPDPSNLSWSDESDVTLLRLACWMCMENSRRVLEKSFMFHRQGWRVKTRLMNISLTQKETKKHKINLCPPCGKRRDHIAQSFHGA